MKLEKAIEVLEDEVRDRWHLHYTEQKDAFTLGIEALKFRQRWEEQEGEDDFPLLPGETKE